GQLKTAANLRKLLGGSQIRESHRNCARVQDAYSLRCIPQVHGPVRDTVVHCREVMEIEVNSAVDNPLVFPSTAHPGAGAPTRPAEHGAAISDPAILSGGNFHGQCIAFVLDFLGIALTALGGISERRIERLVNPALNEGLPP